MLLGVTRRQMRRLPIHRHPDPRASAGMIEENHFLQWTRIELAILTKFKCDHRESIGFARRVDAKGVSFALVHANRRMDDRGKKKEYGRENQREQRKAGRVGDSTNAPAFPPAVD